MNSLLRFCMCLTVSAALTAGFSAPASANSKYAAYVIHADSGDVMFDRYSNERRYPASLTKMMTLYLLFEEIEAGRLTLESELTVSAQAAAQPPSKLGVKAGSKITVETAIEALVVKSANDVAVVVAEAISGSEWRFAQAMTQKARSIGMSRTTFRNASGLPNSRQVTTARDMATLSRRVIQDFPDHYHYFSIPSFTWNGKTYRSHNKVVGSFDGAEGLKTGYTRMSGYNLATSATRDGQRLIGIVLGGRSGRTRDAHMREILGAAFGEIKAKPTLIAALHREPPNPRIKPTLLAELEARGAAPTVADSEAVRDEIILAARNFGGGFDLADDTIGSIIAATDSDDFNEHERTRLALMSPFEGALGEGDVDTISPGWSVQIGAYSTKSMAQKELEAAAVAGGLVEYARMVEPIFDLDGSALYRARFVALSAPDAIDVCDTLRNRERACFVVAEPGAQ